MIYLELYTIYHMLGMNYLLSLGNNIGLLSVGHTVMLKLVHCDELDFFGGLLAVYKYIQPWLGAFGLEDEAHLMWYPLSGSGALLIVLDILASSNFPSYFLHCILDTHLSSLALSYSFVLFLLMLVSLSWLCFIFTTNSCLSSGCLTSDSCGRDTLMFVLAFII